MQILRDLSNLKNNISFSSAFVNFLANMSYTPTLGSKWVYTISSTWGPKLSTNKGYDHEKLKLWWFSKN
jgi:hypothetical protein